MFAAKEETRRTKRSCGQFTMNNSKEFWGHIRKYRHRTYYKRNGLIILTKYFMKIPQPRLRMKKFMGIWER